MGLNPISPTVTVLANEVDISLAIRERLKSLKLVDSTGMESDTLEITLADHDPDRPLRKPSKGAELEVFLGYDSIARRMGLFACDEIQRSGWPGTMTIRARAAVYEKTPKGKTDLQTQKTRSWPKSTKLKDMVAKIAKEHGMEPAVSKSLQAVTLPHMDQTDESDISFLLRVTKRYDAIVKPGGGKLLVAKRGESQSAGGEALPTVTMTADQVTDWSYTDASREAAGGVIAYWQDIKGGKAKKPVKVGEGDPETRLRHHYPTKEAAQAAAQAEYDKRKRGEETFSGTLPGDTNLMAEGRLVLSGFGEGPDGEWLLKKVEHDLGDGGYTCRIEAEKPNAEKK